MAFVRQLRPCWTKRDIAQPWSIVSWHMPRETKLVQTKVRLLFGWLLLAFECCLFAVCQLLQWLDLCRLGFRGRLCNLSHFSISFLIMKAFCLLLFVIHWKLCSGKRLVLFWYSIDCFSPGWLMMISAIRSRMPGLPSSPGFIFWKFYLMRNHNQVANRLSVLRLLNVFWSLSLKRTAMSAVRLVGGGSIVVNLQ